MATTFDITVIRGDDRQITVTYTDRGDISGATIKYTVKDKVDGVQMFQRTVGAGITILDGPAGTFRIDIVPANTSGQTPGDYLHDCEVSVGGKTDTIFRGNFTLEGDIS